MIEVFKAHDIGYFFYNGGGDSADTCFKVSLLAEKMGYPLQAIHVPKTVDNDLPITDCCPGFGSVAKYVAVSIREAGFDVASMASTSTKVFVLEVMGRHAGWIAAAGGLAAQKAGDAPHIILFPEITFDEDKFIARTKECVEKYGYCAVVVSEGVRNAEGKFLADAGTRDAFGHAQLGGVAPVVAQLVKQKLGYKYHWAVADYLQRAARHIASKVDVEQAYAVGKAAVEFARQRPQLRHAGDRAHVEPSVPVEDRHGAARPGRQRREDAAAGLHHPGRPAHHGEGSPVPGTPDPGRGLPALRGRPAALRRAQEQAGAPEAEIGLYGIVARLFWRPGRVAEPGGPAH